MCKGLPLTPKRLKTALRVFATPCNRLLGQASEIQAELHAFTDTAPRVAPATRLAGGRLKQLTGNEARQLVVLSVVASRDSMSAP